uniref:Dymeclin n=1 Tax=Trichuris muris TaxID=70415 RepID=A0A5S6QA64_TRIMR
MGGQISANSKLSENELLRKFSGLEPISENDPFWNLLLSFNFKAPTSRADCKCLDENARDILQSLMYNTGTTGNFAALVRVFLRHAAELRVSSLCQDAVFFWHTNNALLLLRYCCKFFAQRLNEDEFVKLFTHSVLRPDGNLELHGDHEELFDSSLEEFVNALLSVICDLTVESLTFKTLMESLGCLLSMMSHEIFVECVTRSQVTDLILFGRCSIHAPLLTKVLLNCYVSHSSAVYAQQDSERYGGGSFVVGLATSILNILQLGYKSGESKQQEETVGLDDLGLYFLLLLVSHSSPDGQENPYRVALFSFVNSQDYAAQTFPTQATVCFKLNYAELYEQLCERSADRPSLLLLYFLIYKNMEFRNYILSRINLDKLLLPILKVLYNSDACVGNSSSDGSQHIYLALIVVLIFSEDDFFCKIIHETPAKNATWFFEHNVRDLSLGSLIIYTLVKIIRKNVFVLRDRYLQTNCLAALANMSSSFKDLPAFVCQKLIDLLDKLSRRHGRFLKHLELSAKYDLHQAQENPSECLQDVTVLEEAMRMILEIFNSALSSSVNHNVHLVYAILYQRDLFEALEQHPMFQDLIWNIAVVINFFTSRISQLETGTSVEAVIQQIQSAAVNWTPDGLKKFPELKFKYVEDRNTEDFFVPYIWKILYDCHGHYFEQSTVKLFVP